MSIERKLNQSQWGVMRTEQGSYEVRLTNTLTFNLELDGTYYGIAGSTPNSPRIHLLGMVNVDGYTPSGLDGKSIMGVFQEDRNADRLILKSWFVIEQALGVGKSKFTSSTDLLKDQTKYFTVLRTTTGVVLTYLSQEGNSFFRVPVNISTAGVASFGGVVKRQNDSASYRTWVEVLNDATGLTYSATKLVRPELTINNNSLSPIAQTSTVYIYANELPIGIPVVAYNWEADIAGIVTSNLPTWWNARLPGDVFDLATFGVTQLLNHPTAGLLAIFEKERQSDGKVRRYWADFAQGSLVDVSADTSDTGFALDRMVASTANVVCYYRHGNDLHDGSGGNLIYLHYKGLQEKVTAFVTRLVNYDGDDKEFYGIGGGSSSIFFFAYADAGKGKKSAANQIWMRRDNQTFRMEREDFGNVGSDAIGDEFYYATGVNDFAGQGVPIFIGYEKYGAGFGPSVTF